MHEWKYMEEAQRQLQDAQQIMHRAGPDVLLRSQVEDVAHKVTAVEALFKGVSHAETVLSQAREALSAGNRDQANAYCQQARALLDDGIQNESFRLQLASLQEAITKGPLALPACTTWCSTRRSCMPGRYPLPPSFLYLSVSFQPPPLDAQSTAGSWTRLHKT